MPRSSTPQRRASEGVSSLGQIQIKGSEFCEHRDFHFPPEARQVYELCDLGPVYSAPRSLSYQRQGSGWLLPGQLMAMGFSGKASLQPRAEAHCLWLRSRGVHAGDVKMLTEPLSTRQEKL